MNSDTIPWENSRRNLWKIFNKNFRRNFKSITVVMPRFPKKISRNLQDESQKKVLGEKLISWNGS